jgi:hypothetical protein
MDACTYESITGLKNYYGFKSLLKNGTWTQRYSCDDDTIVFNRIESFTFGIGGFSLRSNQVGVVLNASSCMFQVAPNIYVTDQILTQDVDSQQVFLSNESTCYGYVLTQTFSGQNFNTPHNLVLAIFDLY